mgnify:CR=1 FL=1
MYLPLHKLWQDYMKNMLNLQANRYVTKCRSCVYDRESANNIPISQG